MVSLLRRLWTEAIVEPLRQREQESRAFLASPEASRADWKALVVLVATALALTVQECLDQSDVAVIEWLGLERFLAAAGCTPGPRLDKLIRLGFWACGCFVCYFVLPALIVRLVFRERLRNYGVKITGFFSYGWLYVTMLLVMVPLIWLVSRQPAFQYAYPYYRLDHDEPLWPYFWCWQAMYWAQFFAIEFFFRGFMVHGLKHRFGAYAIFVMVIPYCMIHFQKPMLEAFASIVAGLILGGLSLITRSIWLGTFTHIGVAASMDFMALYRRGYFFE